MKGHRVFGVTLTALIAGMIAAPTFFGTKKWTDGLDPQIVEERIIPETLLLSDHISTNFASFDVDKIMSDFGEYVHRIDSVDDLKEMGIYSAVNYSLLRVHDSLYLVDGDLVGMDFVYKDAISDFVEEIKFEKYTK